MVDIDDAQHVAHVTEHVRSAEANATSHPDVAVMLARKAIEEMMRHVYAREVGDPNKHHLDQLIATLRQRKSLPAATEAQLQTVRAFGNVTTNARADEIRPCMAALDEAMKWYRSYANMPGAGVAQPAKRVRVAAAAAAAALLAAGAVTAMLLASGSASDVSRDAAIAPPDAFTRVPAPP